MGQPASKSGFGTKQMHFLSHVPAKCRTLEQVDARALYRFDPRSAFSNQGSRNVKATAAKALIT